MSLRHYRALAELPQKPESVQHWHTDNAHLDSLLDQLSKKPGIHAVHFSAGDKPSPHHPSHGGDNRRVARVDWHPESRRRSVLC